MTGAWPGAIPTRRPLAAPRRWAKAAAGAFLDLLYPPSCLACAAATAGPGALCARCWTRLRFIERPFCERLGTPFAADFGQTLLSPEAMARPPAFGRARAAVIFEEGPARDLVHRLKYGDRPEVARPLGRWMARAGADVLADADALVPVPLHRRRLWSRRYNQAALLADAVGAARGVAVEPFALARIRATRPQVGMSRAERAGNLQGALRAPEAARARIAGRRLVLVDDVMTTGATANAAARALLKAGAASVDVVAFARVVNEGPLPI